MKQIFAFLIAFVGWLAVILQFYLMVENRTASVTETVIRFFSFFTILTNTLVAIAFSVQALGKSPVTQFTPVTLVYLAYILLRGNFSGFYPYPFINVTVLGMKKVLVNAGLLVIFFIVISAIFVWLNRRKLKTAMR
ncbi:MAG: Pr6Pr family membrane protein [Agriterribacter sp.]